MADELKVVLSRFSYKGNNNNNNETPTVHGLAANNNNMQSVLMGNMETIGSYKHNLMK